MPVTLAARIDHLFAAVQPHGREATYREVAAAVAAAGLGPISSSYIWQLRTGAKDNPTRRHIEALAAFFHVPCAYFFDDDEPERERVDVDLAIRAALTNPAVRTAALAAHGLSSESLVVLTAAAERLRELERLASTTR